MNSALLLESVDALIGCKDLEELASGAALLAQRLLGAAGAVVILRSAEREFTSGAPVPSEELRSWAGEWLSAAPASRQVRSGRQAAGIEVPELDVHGVIAVSLELGDRAAGETAAAAARTTAEEQQPLLTALADLAATCSAQLVRRALTERTLQDTRALMARGLHDLCTPLNSLRLGMHLLEPALTTKDPAIAQRAHRAVDRMAALVANLAEAIGAGPSGAPPAQRSSNVSSASQH